MTKHTKYRWRIMCASLLLAACASGTGSTETAPGASDATASKSAGAQVVVENTGSNATSFVIMIEPLSGGVRQNLGPIDPGQSKTFTYSAQPTEYRLIAQGGASGETRSQNFRLTNEDKAVWSIATNRVTLLKK